MQNLTVVCIAFRQNELINAAIGSVDKNLKSANIVKYLIIDNSTIVPFKICEDICGKNAASKIEIVRNYVGYNRKIYFFKDHSHSRGILKAIELCKTDLMLLIDHDIILKNDIDFIDDVVNDDDIIGAFNIRNKFHNKLKMYVKRASPFLMLLNIAKLKKHNIKFYDDTYDKNRSLVSYSTGYTFLQNICKSNLKYKDIDLTKYINHYFRGSAASQEKIVEFLNDNKQYYCNDIAACQIKNQQ